MSLAASATFTPALAAPAAPTRATLIVAIDKDVAQIAAWKKDLNAMGRLGGVQTPMLNDLTSLNSAFSTLRAKTLNDSATAALGSDSESFLALHRMVTSLESTKIRIAEDFMLQRVRFDVVMNKISLGGGLDVHSPIHPQTLALLAKMKTAKNDLDQAIAMVGGATFPNYPANQGVLRSARSLVDQAATIIVAVDRSILSLPLPGTSKIQFELKLWAFDMLQDLVNLRAKVLTDANLTSAERQNLFDQVNADIIAFGELYSFLLHGGHGTAVAAELAELLAEPGVFVLILPKADIMLAASDDRSAMTTLYALIPTLQSRIAGAAAKGRKVSSLNALLADLKSQVASAASGIGPIDAELEPLVAITSTQRSHDALVIESAMTGLQYAATSLAAAKTDADQIVAATA